MMRSPVKTEDDRAPSWPRAPAATQWVGYLAVGPLILGLAGVGLLEGHAARELAQRATLAWGAALLAFTGAVHWGLMLAGRLPWSAGCLAGALAPLVLATLALLAGGQRGLALLVVGFGGLWLYEHRVRGAQLPPDYVNLRRQVSVAICSVLAVTMFLSEAAGLS